MLEIWHLRKLIWLNNWLQTTIPIFEGKQMKKFAIWILLTTITATAWAGDAATLNFIGFSKTGRYLAFQQYGVTDGKGAAYATLYFVDVLDNGYQEKPIETSEDAKSGEPGGKQPKKLCVS
ncbi:MAG: hypothetical protein R3E08_07330 [Thiotrichaceae bacterium]